MCSKADCFRIVGNPRLYEYKKGNRVSFEFNGFSAIDKTIKSSIKNLRIISGKESYTPPKTENKKPKIIIRQTKTFVILEEPGKYFEYRYAFKEPIEFNKVERLTDSEAIKLTWHNSAQVFEVKGHFPMQKEKYSVNVNKLMTVKEKNAVVECM